ncbi:MAG: hypothetical protein JO212_18115 [Acetobacteraceae bacterium]|nr:hypothetical protein [Acetobacteraceae bacterium]
MLVQVETIVFAEPFRAAGLTEAEMRTVVTTLAGLITLVVISARATPPAPTQGTGAEQGVGPPIELDAHGCLYGDRRTRWQDQWGHWHRGRCVPDWWGSLSRHQFSQ